jgi:cytochrome c553
MAQTRSRAGQPRARWRERRRARRQLSATGGPARHCAECHGRGGEGDAGQFYPKASGQHFKYLLRGLIDIPDGVRLNQDRAASGPAGQGVS